MAKGKPPPSAILSDGQTRVPPPGKARTNLGGSKPPQKPKARRTPPPGAGMAIGQRPVLAKTRRKIAAMQRGRGLPGGGLPPGGGMPPPPMGGLY